MPKSTTSISWCLHKYLHFFYDQSVKIYGNWLLSKCLSYVFLENYRRFHFHFVCLYFQIWNVRKNEEVIDTVYLANQIFRGTLLMLLHIQIKDFKNKIRIIYGIRIYASLYQKYEFSISRTNEESIFLFYRDTQLVYRFSWYKELYYWYF